MLDNFNYSEFLASKVCRSDTNLEIFYLQTFAFDGPFYVNLAFDAVKIEI